jgi:hypothetical protein
MEDFSFDSQTENLEKSSRTDMHGNCWLGRSPKTRFSITRSATIRHASDRATQPHAQLVRMCSEEKAFLLETGERLIAIMVMNSPKKIPALIGTKWDTLTASA